MKRKTNLTVALIISMLLHAVLVIVLLWGADFNAPEPKPSVNLVQAVVIDPALVQKQAKEIRQKRQSAMREEQERLDELRKQSDRLEKNRKAEEKRIRELQADKAKADKAAREAEKQKKLEQEKWRLEKKRIAKVEAERKQKQAEIEKAEQKRLAKEAEIEKAEKAAKKAQEKARIESERAAKAQKAAEEAKEKARKEQEQLKKLEKERKEREAALGDIFAGLEKEAEQNSSAKQRFITSELDRYGAIYKQLIQNNLLMEKSYKGKFCRVILKLLPTGKDAILSGVEVRDGDSQLCAATKRAVAQVRSFPLPTDKSVADSLRNINLTVAPE